MTIVVFGFYESAEKQIDQANALRYASFLLTDGTVLNSN